MTSPDDLRYAAAMRERLAPLPQPALPDWEADDRCAIDLRIVDGFFIVATGEFLIKGGEPEMTECKAIIHPNYGGDIHNGSLGISYGWDGSKWKPVDSCCRQVCLSRHPDYAYVKQGVFVDNYGNLILYLPHTTIYVVLSLVPLCLNLFTALFRAHFQLAGYMHYNNVPGAVCTSSWRESMAPMANNSEGLPFGTILFPVVIKSGRRHVLERSTPEKELIARLCTKAADVFKESFCYRKFQFYRNIQCGLAKAKEMYTLYPAAIHTLSDEKAGLVLSLPSPLEMEMADVVTASDDSAAATVVETQAPPKRGATMPTKRWSWSELKL